MSLKEWFDTNIFTNIFTVISIILSGLISWVVSAIYYYRGNRNNLKMSVIHPIISLLNDRNSKQIYKVLCDISKEYSTRYMKKRERKRLILLINAYKKISTYNDTKVDADSLFSYFEYQLKKNEIVAKYFPIKDDEDEVVYYDYPPDLFYLSIDLERVLSKYNIDFQEEEAQDELASLYSSYCKEHYTSKKISFFDDYSLSDILAKSKIRSDWDHKFVEIENAKKVFLDLKVCRTSISKQHLSNKN